MHRVLAALSILLLCSEAFAASTVNPNVPATNGQLASGPVRNNFAAAYSDINNLLGNYAGTTPPINPINTQTWVNTSTSPVYVFEYYNSFNNIWVPYASLNISTNLYTPVFTTGGFAATPPLAVTVPGGVATYSIGLDSNFANNVSNQLSFATIANGHLLANCSGSSPAEPGNCTWNSFATQAIGSINGIIPSYVSGSWGTVTTGTSAHAIPFLDGSNTFSALQTIYPGTAGLRTPLTGTILKVVSLDTTITRIEGNAYGAAVHFSGARSDGTAASPTGLVNLDEIVGFNAFGNDTTSSWVGPYAGWRCYATETWSSTAHGTRCDVATTPNTASAALASVIGFENDGGITVPSTVTGGDQGAGTLNLAGGLYNAGTAPTGTGGYVRATSPALVTPALGAATGASLALGGASLSGNALAVTGTGQFNSAVTLSSGLVVTGTSLFSGTVDTTSNANVQEIANAGTTGTTVNKLAKLTGSPGTAVIATTTDTTGNVIGIVIGQAGTTGNAQIAITGQASCIFDGAVTAQHYAQVSISAGGLCHDGGATYPTSGQVLGIIITTNASPGSTPQAITLFPPGVLGSGASGSGTVTTITGGNGVSLSSGTNCTTTCTVAASMSPPTGRITLLTGTPVMAASQAGATSVIYTPYLPGDTVPLYNGTTYVPTPFTEVSQATSDTTKSPAAVAASSCYDLFAWSDSGTFRVTRGPAWTNCTTRSAGSALTTGSTPLNSVSITNGPAASRGTWVGSIASNASSTIDYIFGAVGSGGTAAAFNLCNAFNRVLVRSFTGDSTASWTYGTATWRAPNGNATMRTTFMSCGTNDSAMGEYGSLVVSTTNSSTACNAAVGLNMTTNYCGRVAFCSGSGGTGPFQCTITSRCEATPPLGQNFLSALEFAPGASTCTYGGYNTGNTIQSGLSTETWQ